MILSENIGDYSQTIRIYSDCVFVKVSQRGKVLYDGLSRGVEDKQNILTVTTPAGCKKEFVKYITMQTI